MVENNDKETLYDKMLLELRRGILVLAVLSQLEQEQYGYSLKQSLNDRGLDINEGTLYPLMRRLESQGLLESEWQVVDDTRPRRYYRISSAGTTILANLKQDWQELTQTMNQLLQINDGGDKWKPMN
ncbi:MAG: PadR family transcriptional regulator [Ardenticatenaceae bacterium]|nr:PadR family transcriptional regulator [Ardenticatenaceae bacterium]MCB9445480.1 PadR family transcriptional regulator [Ardenticatenaceae bacterium]